MGAAVEGGSGANFMSEVVFSLCLSVINVSTHYGGKPIMMAGQLIISV